MKDYKIEITSTTTYTLDVRARNEDEARGMAEEQWNKIAANGTAHYYQQNDEPHMEYGNIYDVTGTDDAPRN